MSVFVITGGWEYEGEAVIHASSTRELAEQWLADNSETVGRYDFCNIVELIVDAAN